jgi:hypothetical protein
MFVLGGVGLPFNGRSVYTSAVQSLAVDFQHYIDARQITGLMVLDSRNKPKNTNVSHSVFTPKFWSSGDAYHRLMEMPLFGHSDNHAGIQAADMICSAFLFPMAAYVYCLGHVNNIHVHSQYYRIRDRFGERLKRMQTNGGMAALPSAMASAAKKGVCCLPWQKITRGLPASYSMPAPPVSRRACASVWVLRPREN